MWLSKLKVKNFRNYNSLEVIFEKGINYLYGSNGVGKTNLIEAIYYISNLESFRTNEDRNLLKENKGEFFIEGVIENLDYSLLVSKDSKLLSIDGIVYKKYREYLGHANVVEFIPEEVYLLKDFPKDRRKFMDKEISKIDKSYMDKLLIYNKLIKQRNELLKSEDNYKEELLFVIDDKISELQVEIINKRKDFLNQIETIINGFNTSLNNLYEFRISYMGSFEKITKEEILNKYKMNLEKDKEKRITGLGVHKDDFKIYINNNDASDFGSQGEQRFIVLLVKLALVNLIKEKIKEYPILVLDDVFSELDETRKKEVYRIINEFDQVFITGCNYEEIKEINNISKYQIKENKIFKIKEEINNE